MTVRSSGRPGGGDALGERAARAHARKSKRTDRMMAVEEGASAGEECGDRRQASGGDSGD